MLYAIAALLLFLCLLGLVMIYPAEAFIQGLVVLGLVLLFGRLLSRRPTVRGLFSRKAQAPK